MRERLTTALGDHPRPKVVRLSADYEAAGIEPAEDSRRPDALPEWQPGGFEDAVVARRRACPTREPPPDVQRMHSGTIRSAPGADQFLSHAALRMQTYV
jgi:hypothetical protein